MCTILIAHKMSNRFPLLVLANRDEFYNRPTSPALEWEEAPGLYAGRDLVSGGSWFGVRNGRWASVTNIREGINNRDIHQKSRGWLVRDYLLRELPAEDYLQQLHAIKHEFAGFNLLLGEDEQLWYTSTRNSGPQLLKPGVYGLSNHLLDTPWPKVVRGKQDLKALLMRDKLNFNLAFSILADTTQAADKDLPDTGIPLEWERALSATFINFQNYGTRCSSLLVKDMEGEQLFMERRFSGSPDSWEENHFSWPIS